MAAAWHKPSRCMEFARLSFTSMVALVCNNYHLLRQIWKMCFYNATFAYIIEDSKSAHGTDNDVSINYF